MRAEFAAPTPVLLAKDLPMSSKLLAALIIGLVLATALASIGGCPAPSNNDVIAPPVVQTDDNSSDDDIFDKPPSDAGGSNNDNDSSGGDSTGGDTTGGDSTGGDDTGGGDQSGDSNSPTDDPNNTDANTPDPNDANTPDANEANDPNAGDPNADLGAQFAGTWAATLTRTRIEELNEGAPNTFNDTVDISFDIATSLRPTTILVPGYREAIDMYFPNIGVGAPQSKDGTDGSYDATVTVTIVSLRQTDTSMTIQLELEHQATSGSATETGTGTQEIQITIDGASLTYRSVREYNVELANGAIKFDIRQVVTDEGTLALQ